MVNISTMKHTKTAGSRTPTSQRPRLHLGNIYRTGPSNDRPFGSINNSSLDLEGDSDSCLLRTIGRVRT
ncbi:hypothetical protein B5K08_18625 [Rhizobium leguminosarum bv. trifolii]|uniref:Uncharacterized protein n=1 Tax=Rhizobium leguminosarum bv. trifolii TaxID=386 RepID=A0A3E1BG49_RHILT|nr:hypothetical protein B5K08_18625 [Rhizobium leguminosarum bv. trifolii]RFB91314.1 hypothetical protein B5K10_18620 [Rhizobium leguminosarum bv. trifolii]